MQRTESARSTGSRPRSDRSPSRTHVPDSTNPCALTRRGSHSHRPRATTYVLKASMPVARRLSDNPPASITSASGISKCPPTGGEACISNSATLNSRLHSRLEGAGGGSCAGGHRGPDHFGRHQRSWLARLAGHPSRRGRAGIDIHAQVIEHLLTGQFLERPDYALALEEFVILALGLILAFALPQFQPKRPQFWLSHNSTHPIRRVGRLSILESSARSVISSPHPRQLDSNYHLLHLSYRRGAAHADSPRFRPIPFSLTRRTVGANPREARARRRRA